MNTLHSEITAVTTGLTSELPGRDHAAEVGSVIAGPGCSLEDLTVVAPTNDPFRLGAPGPLPGSSASASLHGRYIALHLTQAENTIAAGSTRITIARIPDLRCCVPIGVACGK